MVMVSEFMSRRVRRQVTYTVAESNILSWFNPAIGPLPPCGQLSINRQSVTFLDLPLIGRVPRSVTFVLGDYRSAGPTRGGYRIGRPAQSILVRRSICADQFPIHRCEAEPVADQVGH